MYLGIVHVFDLHEPKVTRREQALTQTGSSSIQELHAQCDDFESWSQFALEALRCRPARTSQTAAQGTFDGTAKEQVKETGQRLVPLVLEALHDSRLWNARYTQRRHRLTIIRRSRLLRIYLNRLALSRAKRWTGCGGDHPRGSSVGYRSRA